MIGILCFFPISDCLLTVWLPVLVQHDFMERLIIEMTYVLKGLLTSAPIVVE